MQIMAFIILFSNPPISMIPFYLRMQKIDIKYLFTMTNLIKATHKIYTLITSSIFYNIDKK